MLRIFCTQVEKAGYQWEVWHAPNARADKRVAQSQKEPIWRESPPWNKQPTQRVLLKPNQSKSVRLTPQGTLVDGAGKVLYRPPTHGHATEEATFAAFQDFQQREFRTVYPAREDSALFRHFAGLEPNQHAICEFANRFGLLWVTAIGIPFAEWEYEIVTMRLFIDMWDHISERNTKKLSESFEKRSGLYRYRYVSALPYRRYRSEPTWLEVHADARAGSILDVAREFVCMGVNNRLEELPGHLELNSELLATKKDALQWMPDSLLGFMWSQFAESISEHKQYRQCKSCKRYIDLTPHVNRGDRQYCNNACRNQALRKRQRLARKMRKDGSSLHDIARATDSKINTIKDWVEKGK